MSDAGKEPFVPRYRRLADLLIGEMRSGVYRNGESFPSEREIGLAHDLSRQTVRNAYKILIEEGWIVTQPGRGSFVQVPPRKPGGGEEEGSGVGVRTKQIGIIMRNSQFREVAAALPILGIKSAVSECGYSVSISVSNKDSKNGLHPQYPQWLKEGAMEGYLLLSAPPKAQEAFSRLKVPVLSLGYRWTDAELASLEVDFGALYHKAVDYLVERGCLPFCCMVGTDRSVEVAKFNGEVLEGFHARVAELGLAKKVSVVRYQDTCFDYVRAVRRVLRGKTPPKALLLGSGNHLEEVMNAIESLGYQVPRDLLVLVMDSFNLPRSCSRQVAYFEIDTLAAARRAGEKLLELIRIGESVPKNERFVGGVFHDPIP